MCTQSLDGITTSSNHEYYSPQIILHKLLVDVQMYGYHKLEYFSLLVLGIYYVDANDGLAAANRGFS